MPILEIVTIVYVVVVSFCLMYAPGIEIPPRKIEKVLVPVCILIWIGLSIWWGIALIADGGWPDSMAVSIVHCAIMSVVAALCIVAAMIAVVFVWMIIMSLFFPAHYEKFFDQDAGNKNQDKS